MFASTKVTFYTRLTCCERERNMCCKYWTVSAVRDACRHAARVKTNGHLLSTTVARARCVRISKYYPKRVSGFLVLGPADMRMMSISKHPPTGRYLRYTILGSFRARVRATNILWERFCWRFVLTILPYHLSIEVLHTPVIIQRDCKQYFNLNAGVNSQAVQYNTWMDRDFLGCLWSNWAW